MLTSIKCGSIANTKRSLNREVPFKRNRTGEVTGHLVLDDRGHYSVIWHCGMVVFLGVKNKKNTKSFCKMIRVTLPGLNIKIQKIYIAVVAQ